MESGNRIALVFEYGVNSVKLTGWSVETRNQAGTFKDEDANQAIAEFVRKEPLFGMAVWLVAAEHQRLVGVLQHGIAKLRLVSCQKRKRASKEHEAGTEQQDDTVTGKLFEACNKGTVYLSTALGGGKLERQQVDGYPTVWIERYPTVSINVRETSGDVREVNVDTKSDEKLLDRVTTELRDLIALALLSMGSRFEPPLSLERPKYISEPLVGRIVSRAVLYRQMVGGLLEQGRGQVTRLMSTQPLDPRLENEPAIVAWHTGLEGFAGNAANAGAELRRLVALDEPRKWPWLAYVLEKFEKLPVKLSMRVLPMLADGAGRRPPLPIQLNLIGGRVFVAGARASLEESAAHIIGHIIETEPIVRNYTEYYDRLWLEADAFPHATLMHKGKPRPEAIEHVKAQLCLNWLVLRAQTVAREEDFQTLVNEALQLHHFVPDWWRGLVRSSARDPGAPYARRVLVESERVEIMLATWNEDPCWPHCHGGNTGFVHVLQGEARVRDYKLVEGEPYPSLKLLGGKPFHSGDRDRVNLELIHDMQSTGLATLVTLHMYLKSPGASGAFRVFDLANKRFGLKHGGGAYAPLHDFEIDWQRLAPGSEER